MNAYESELREKWNAIDYHFGGSLQLSVPHALEWHVRYVTENQKSLVIVSDVPVDKIVSSQSIEAACNRRRDGKYAVSFTLVNRSQEDVFIAMSSNIIEYSENEKTHNGALSKVLRRYSQWLKLLDHKRSTTLGENAQKGLIAELLFLKETIENGRNPADALAGWVGPDGADQDFVYEDGRHEIKATGVASTSVSISSIEQLDADVPGALVVYRVDKCAPNKNGSVTLNSVVKDVLVVMRNSPACADEFTLKLASAGYIQMDEYDNCTFFISSIQRYEINDDFPKLSRRSIPQEITAAEYRIDLPSITPWIR